MDAPSNAAPPVRRAVVMVLMLAAVGWVGGCADDDAADSTRAGDPTGAGAEDPTFDLPEWIRGVHPDPGAEASPTPQVQVLHGEVGVREGVRLSVDGVDVTPYTVEVRPGVLTYDPNRSTAPVELDPGRHRAMAERVRLDKFGEQHDVIDRFEWEFVVQ